VNEERAEVFQSVDGSWTASAHNGERGFTQPGLDTEQEAWARAQRWLASQNDSPLYGHDDDDGCWPVLMLVGAIPVAMTLTPLWWLL
jgi:hypothetical protein